MAVKKRRGSKSKTKDQASKRKEGRGKEGEGGDREIGGREKGAEGKDGRGKEGKQRGVEEGNVIVEVNEKERKNSELMKVRTSERMENDDKSLNRAPSVVEDGGKMVRV